MSEPLLSPEALRRLEQFQLLAARRAKSGSKGERRSRARGQSVEFADHRNYSIGDDFRYLDWNLFGRLDRLFIKLYEEERELPVTIFLDLSESMRFGRPSKAHFATQLAAAIGYTALCGFDRVSVRAFPGSEDDRAARNALRSIRGRRSSMTFFHRLQDLRCGGLADLNEALRLGALESKAVGVAVVLSDFLDPAGYESGIQSLVARGFQIHAIQILAPEEVDPGQFGELRVIDSESGSEVDVTFGKARLASYQQTVANFRARLREYLVKRGVSFTSITSDSPLEPLLLKQLREAQLWG